MDIINSIIASIIVIVFGYCLSFFWKTKFLNKLLTAWMALNNTFQTNVYVNIAKGYSDRTSLTIYSSTSIVFAAFSVAYISLGNKLLFITMGFISLFGLFATLCEQAIVQYEQAAIHYIHQSISICSPYISELEKKQLESQLSSTANKNDYEALNKNLIAIADNNNVKLPKFNIL